MFNIVGYRSVVLSLFIYYPVLALLQKIFRFPILDPSIIFPILVAPLLISLKRIHIAGPAALAAIAVALVTSYALEAPSDDTFIFTISLIIGFAVPACFLASVSFDLGVVMASFKVLAPLNLFLLLYVAFFRQDIYLDRDQMNYMTFGYWALLSFLGFLTLLYLTANKIWLVPAIVCFVLIFLFGARFATISALISILVIRAYFKGVNLNLLLILGALIVSLVMAWVFQNALINGLINALEAFEIAPTNLYRLRTINVTETDASLDGRFYLLHNSLEVLLNNPFGVGIYGYQSALVGDTGAIFRYPHNLFVQLGLEYGFLGLTLLTALGIRGLFIIFRRIPPRLGWLAVMQICLCSKLVISGTYLWEPSFWLSVVLGWKAWTSTLMAQRTQQSVEMQLPEFPA